jgi:hypothetical protein
VASTAFHVTIDATAPGAPTVPLFGVQFTYADGSTFYTASVAGDIEGVVVGAGDAVSKLLTNPAGDLVGSYRIFSDGVTNRAAGSVEINRLIESKSSFVPGTVTGTTFHGFAGLGSEAGTIRINGYVLSFSGQVEPVLPVKIITIPIEPAPSAPDAFTAELNVIYREVLARNPDPSGISTYTRGAGGRDQRY